MNFIYLFNLITTMHSTLDVNIIYKQYVIITRGSSVGIVFVYQQLILNTKRNTQKHDSIINRYLVTK
jgi:hypothetical protein